MQRAVSFDGHAEVRMAVFCLYGELVVLMVMLRSGWQCLVYTESW